MVAFEGREQIGVDGRCVTASELHRWLGQQLAAGRGDWVVAVETEDELAAFVPRMGDRAGVLIFDATEEVG